VFRNHLHDSHILELVLEVKFFGNDIITGQVRVASEGDYEDDYIVLN